MSDLPLIMTAAGPSPTPPAQLLAILIANVSATNPDFTANLPLSLIEDMTSTQVGGLSLIDQARVDTVSAFSPLGVNDYMIAQLGQVYGLPVGQAVNVSGFVVFSSNNAPGWVIPKDTIVSDGVNQYLVQDGGVIGASGSSASLFVISTTPGDFAVPAGTVQQIITQIPTNINLTVNNPTAFSQATGPQDATEYRASVLQAGLAIAVGLSTFLRTQLARVVGVQPQLVSAIQPAGTTTWEVIVGGGDPYQVAYAIYRALNAGIALLVGSTISVTAITNANPAVVTVNKNHNYASGQIVTITGATGITGVNSNPQACTVVSERVFSLPINTTSSGAYTGNGVISPVLRNQAVTITDYPDTYIINYVAPPVQAVTMTATWNTTSPNFVSTAAIAQAAAPALADYINSIPVGQPINVDVMVAAFQTAITNILPSTLLTRLVFAVSINGVATAVSAGTVIIVGDPESSFSTDDAGGDINVVQG